MSAPTRVCSVPQLEALARPRGSTSLSIIDDIDEMIDGPVGGHWRELGQVPSGKRIEILDWLQATSSLPPRQGLTLEANRHSSSMTSVVRPSDESTTIAFALSPHEEARITNWDGGSRILHLAPGVTEEWHGPHDALEEPLDTLSPAIAGEEAKSQDSARGIRLQELARRTAA